MDAGSWRRRRTRRGCTACTPRCPTAEARRRCPHAAFLTGRFHAYGETSARVMELLRSITPLVEPLSMDEAFLDLTAADLPDHSVSSVTALGRRLKEQVHEVTGGLTGSVGIATSKLVAKIASDLDKPDGLVVVEPGTEVDLLRPMNVSVIPGVGPATSERLRRIGVHTVEELHSVSEDELVRVVGAGPRTRALPAVAGGGRPRRPARARDEVDQHRGHLRDRPRRQAAARGPARPAGDEGRRTAADGEDVGPHRDRRRSGSTTSRRTPGPRPCPHRPTTAGWCPGWPAPWSARWTPPAASASSGSACPGWPTGSRTTCSRTRSRTPRRPWRRCSPSSRPRARRTHPGWTSSTRPTGKDGCGGRAGAWSPCGSRPPRPGREG